MNDQEIMVFLNGLKRPAFFPQIRMEPTRTGSRYFGAPWMEDDWAQGPEKPYVDAVLVMQISQTFSPAADAFAEDDCTVIGVAHIWFSPAQNRFLHDWAI